jgi:hypothetical protein
MSQTFTSLKTPRSGLRVSVVINTCDRAQPLRRLLYALNRQTYPDFEVVVVVGPTRDNTLEMLADFEDQVYVVCCPVFNMSTSRNYGLSAAMGDIVAFIDDDAIPALTWLEQIVAVYLDPQVAGIGGRTYMVHPGLGHLQFLSGIASVLAEQEDIRPNPQTPVPVNSKTPPKYWVPRLMGTNMSYRRRVLLAVCGFDERFTYLFEEPDLAVRLAKSGHKIHHSTEAVVYHAPANSRNRETFTWNINWYAWLRGSIYFSLKNGRNPVGLARSMTMSLEYALNFFNNARSLYHQQAISGALYKKILKQLVKGCLWGFWYGLFLPRSIPQKIEPIQRDFKPFLRNDSHKYPAIAPLGDPLPERIRPMPTECLRIALLSLEYPPEKTDGIARCTAMLAQGLSELGHEVHVIKEGVADRVTYYGGTYVHEVRTKETHRYRNYRQQGYPLAHQWLNSSHTIFNCVQSLLINHRIQVVDTQNYHLDGLVTAVAGVVPVVVRLSTSIKQIVEITGQSNLDNYVVGELEKKLVSLSQGIVANSQASYQVLADVYNLDVSKLSQPVTVIHHGINPIPEAEVVTVAATSKLDPIILFVGRLEKRKGILDLFKAISPVIQQFPTAQFWIAGQDNSEVDGFKAVTKLDYPTYFQRHYPEYSANVRFLGFVPDDKLPQLYQVCDLVVAPSLYESFGLVYLEAMNYARPVIGCNVGGPTEIIVDGETGRLVPPQAPEALAEAIGQLLLNPGLRHEMGCAGRQRLLDRFSHLKMAAEFVAFYKTVIEKGVAR